MRKKLLKWNTSTSFINQIVTIICGFILPRLMLQAYGSDVNGLVNSIVQFLQVITFLELGVGAVVQSALYKPLADHNDNSVSKIFASAQKFFRRLGLILIIYVVLLIIFYPYFVKNNFGWGYTAFLIVAISISTFAQYYFGMTNTLLLTADQHGYVKNITQFSTVIANTIACTILIKVGAGIHIVKLTTSVIYLIRPLVLQIYVKKHYSINPKIAYIGEPIKQKWNGIAQHVAFVVLEGTDNIVLTLFSTLANVSIYSVYQLVIAGVKSLMTSITNGIQPLIGELWAKKELTELNKIFGKFEWMLHTGTVFIFGCTAFLIVPFVAIYTRGVTDADYIQPLFAYLLTLANACHCLRTPYNVMILAAGHYKATQSNYIIAAVMNIVLSIVFVSAFGLVGVALGTLVAMIYQTVWMANYISKHLNRWPIKNFYKQMMADLITVAISAFACHWITLENVNYISWILMAIKIALIWIIVTICVNCIFYRKRMKNLFKGLLQKV